MRISEVILLIMSVACIRAQNRPCNCIPLQKCPVVNTHLQMSGFQSNPAFWYDKLNAWHCKFDGPVPYICCPSIGDSTLHSTGSTKDNSLSVKANEFLLPKIPPSKPLKHIMAKIMHKIRDRVSGSVTDVCGEHLIRDQNSDVVTSEFPWVALLEYSTRAGIETLCGGVLISDQFVLTAAHCVTSVANKLLSVLLGKQDLKSADDCTLDENAVRTKKCINTPVRVKVGQKIVNDKYSGDLLPRGKMRIGDLALLKLEVRVPFSDRIQPICLPLRRSSKDTFYVSGWSKSMIPKTTGLQQKNKSKVLELDLQTCKKHPLLGIVSNDKICVGVKQPQESPCIADAGGPLMAYERRSDGNVRMSLYGISSLDLACGRNDLPGVYTRTFEYLPWIHQYVQGVQILR